MLMMLLHLLFVIHVLQTGVDTLGTPVHIETGENVTLNCSYEEKVQWLFKKKDSNELEEVISDNRLIRDECSAHYAIIGDETYNLQIINATHSNEGRYWCFTTNVTDNESVQYFQLRLKEPPSEVRVINSSEENTIIGKEKENLTLACYTLGGIPRGKTIWYHGMKKVAMNNDNSEWTNYSLILDKNHNGQIFTCMAEHDMLETPLNQTIKLNILYHPRVQIIWPKRPILVGHSVNLSCSYDSNPLDADILWSKSGKRMSSGNRISTTKAGKSETILTELEMMTIDDFQGFYNQNIIMLEKVTKVDAGEYTCNVTNDVGSANDTAFLVVQEIDSRRNNTDETNKPSAILIYIVVCCCGVIIFVSSAEMYSCLKSGKLKTFLGKRGKLEIFTINGVTVPLQIDNTVQNEVEMSTTHYMEIDF